MAGKPVIFQYINGLIFVVASLEGKKGIQNITCVVDTGAAITAVRTSILDSLGYSIQDSEKISKTISIQGSVEEGYLLKVKKFILGDVKISNLLVDAIDIYNSSHFPNIDCLIGNNFLNNYQVTIDYRKELIILTG